MRKFCAHRGLSALMPENTLPAFAAALAFGADEIEFDVRLTRDQRMIISHDGNLERISDGKGELKDFTLRELRELNVGGSRGWTVPFCTAEEVFALLAGKITFNMHLKEHGEEGYLIRELTRLTDRYNAHGSAYFAGSPAELAWMERIAPEMPRVAIQLRREEMHILDMAREYHCAGVQFWLGMFDRALIDTLHGEGRFCNLFYADDAEGYRTYFDMGIDTILTNRMDLAARYRRHARG